MCEKYNFIFVFYKNTDKRCLSKVPFTALVQKSMCLFKNEIKLFVQKSDERRLIFLFISKKKKKFWFSFIFKQFSLDTCHWTGLQSTSAVPKIASDWLTGHCLLIGQLLSTCQHRWAECQCVCEGGAGGGGTSLCPLHDCDMTQSSEVHTVLYTQYCVYNAVLCAGSNGLKL